MKELGIFPNVKKTFSKSSDGKGQPRVNSLLGETQSIKTLSRSEMKGVCSPQHLQNYQI